MSSKRKYLGFLSFIIIFFSCKEKNTSSNKQEIRTNSYTEQTKFEYEFLFPDTVYTDKSYDGKIIFKSPLDSITEKIFEPKIYRYVVFRLPSKVNYNSNNRFYNDSLAEYRFGAVNNRTIPFYDISFNKRGVFYLDGIVHDIILIDTLSDSNKTRLIDINKEVRHKVVVIE